MKKWTVWCEGSSRYPTEMTEVPGRPSGPHMVAGPTFEAPDRQTAEITFKRWLRDGLPHNPYIVPDAPTPANVQKMWRHKGSAHYIHVQGRQMGMTEAQIKKAASDSEIGKFDRVMGEVSRTYHTTRTAQAGIFTSFPESTKTTVGYSLKEYESYVATACVLASAVTVAVDEAWRAFGMEPPERPCQILIGPPPIVEVRSTEDAQKIDAQNTEISALKAEIDALETSLGKALAVEPADQAIAKPAPAQPATLEPTCKDYPAPEPETVEPTPAPEPAKAPPPIQRKHQNPKHPSNNPGVR